MPNFPRPLPYIQWLANLRTTYLMIEVIVIMIAKSTFKITKWEDSQYSEEGQSPVLSRATVEKEFDGELVGTSSAEVLMCVSDADDYTVGAGFVASEVVRGSLNGIQGSFAYQHGGLSGPDGQHTFGTIIPGSGTDGLAGISGTTILAKDETGHHITVEYDLYKD